MKSIQHVCGVFVFFVLSLAAPAQAFILINEVLADPASGMEGDANGDGVRSSTGDEFIELLNTTAHRVNISGWSLTDLTQQRHIFPSNTFIQPYTYFIVFGGGDPQLMGVTWQLASTGSLSLNNGGDEITLFDENLNFIDQVIYDDLGNRDQSMTRFPEGDDNPWHLHREVSSHGSAFSPGHSLDGQTVLSSTAVIPEFVSGIYLCLGALLQGIHVFWQRR